MRKITLWPYTTATTAFNIHQEKVRQLLHLPVRKGEIKSVTFNGNSLTIVFEKRTNTTLTIK